MVNSDPLRTAPKCRTTDSMLVVVDIQQRLGDAMPGKVLNRVVLNASLLARSAAVLEIPVIVTEQYPQGLGDTLARVREALPRDTIEIEKTSFSCAGSERFLTEIEQRSRRQIILVGMEAHICILQTALDLHAAGFAPFVVEDAICSRRLENYQNALDRLRQSGVQVASAESVVFEWIGHSGHEHFKAIQALLR